MARHSLTLEALVRGDRAVRRAVEGGLDELAPGLSFGDWQALYEIGRANSIVGKWLSVEMGRTQQHVSNSVKRLAKAGLVEQTPDPVDPRRKLIALTATGERVDAALTQRARLALGRALR